MKAERSEEVLAAAGIPDYRDATGRSARLRNALRTEQPAVDILVARWAIG